MFLCSKSYNGLKNPENELPEKCPYSELFWSTFSVFGLNTERYGVSLHIQSKCRKMRTWITPNTDTFYLVISAMNKKPFFYNLHVLCTRRKSKDGLTKNVINGHKYNKCKTKISLRRSLTSNISCNAFIQPQFD